MPLPAPISAQRAALTEEAITTLQSKIQKTEFDQCIKCHITKAHKEHPTFERDKTPTGQPEGTLYPPRRGGFLLQGH